MDIISSLSNTIESSENNPNLPILDFPKYKEGNIFEKEWENVQKMNENNMLKPYQETLTLLKKPNVIFDNDETLLTNRQIESFIESTFKGDLLKKGLITEILISLNTVNYQAPSNNVLGIDKGEYYIPRSVFSEWYTVLPTNFQDMISKNIFHGEGYSNWNIDSTFEWTSENLVKKGNVFPSPIVIYNHEFDRESILIKKGQINEAGLSYLAAIPENDRLEKYTLSTISHEVGHNLFANVVHNSPLLDEFITITDMSGVITEYAGRYKGDLHTYYNEYFAEAVRIYTINKSYLDEKGFSEVAHFIEKNFPDIRSDL